MHDRAELASRIHGWDRRLTVDSSLAREFEERLLESSTLAVCVAYSVLRNREDAEDVAQDAFAKAYRSFNQLRERDRFRAWLVRMTWRMALDRQRSNRRRQAHVAEAGLQTRLDQPVETTAELVAARERDRKSTR